MKKKFSIALICISLIAMSFIQVQNLAISKDSQVTFKIKSALGMVNGSVGGLSGIVVFDPAHLSASDMDVTLDLSTIATGNGKRDKDIKDETSWFDIAKFPKIAFKSSSVTTSHGDYMLQYFVEGNLTIKGISKKVTIPFTFDKTESGGTFRGTLKINRLDYGIYKSTMLVKDTVEVTINVPVKK